jgi:hypothetical protein
MSIFSNIGHFFGDIFGGNDPKKKKPEQYNPQPRQSAPAPVVRNNAPQFNYQAPQKSSLAINNNTNSQQNNTVKPNNGVNLVVPGGQKTPPGFPTVLQKPQPADTRTPGQKEIDQLTAQHLPAAIQQEKSRTSWFDRTVTDRNWQDRAMVTARNQALRDYQDKYGYKRQPEVIHAENQNKITLNNLQHNNENLGHALDTVQHVADKAAQVAQYVPVTGSVMNLGLAGAQRLAKATHNDAYAQDIADQRNKNEFGMTPEEYNKLDAKTKGKLQVLRNAGYALSPLDVFGLTGLAKSEGVNVTKNAAVQLARHGAVDEATKTAVKTLGKDTAKNLLKTTGVGFGISAAGQEYLSGKVDPLSALKSGAMVAGSNELFNPTQLRKAPDVHPGLSSANPTQVEDATKAHAATVAQQDTQQPPIQEGGFVSPHEQLGTQQRQAEVQQIANDPTPAYQRRAANDQAALDQPAPATDLIDTPAFERQGKQLPSQTQQTTDQALRDNAVAITQDPAFADMISHSYRVTGSSNPLSLVMHALSNIPDKATVRAIVERLLPDANPNTLNRAVNTITGAHTPQDIADALTEASQRAAGPNTPFGPLSDAPAPAPSPGAVPTPAPTQATPVPTPAEVQPPAPAAVAQPAEVAPQPTVVAPNPAEVAPTPNPQPSVAPVGPSPAATPAELPGVPQPGMADQAPAAPLTHDAIASQLGAKDLKGNAPMRDVVHLDELKQQAAGAIANMSDEQLVQTFSSANPDTLVHDPQTFALARASLDRLYAMKDNPVAEQQVTNILDAMAKYTSKNAQGLRIVQEEFDNMPLPMKVRYLVKKIDAANVDTKGYEPLARDPAKQAEIEAALTARLTASQNVAERVAAIEDQLSRIADSAKNGQKSDVNIKSLVKSLRTEKTNLEATNGELVKYFQSLVPGRGKLKATLVDFPKRAMLASFTGRLNDVLTTAANIGSHQTNNVTQGLISSAVNLVKPGTVTNTFKGGMKLANGVKTGLQKFGGEVMGKQYVGDVQASIKGNEDLRSGLRKPGGKISRTVQAATEFATNASTGVRDQRLVQLAHQEGVKAGLKGDLLKQYTEARAAVPSRDMRTKAEQLHLEVNNLNHNLVSDALNNVAKSIEGKSVVGGILKNQVMPFTSWLGGNIYNSVTDKNVIASSYKFLRDAKRGDAEGAVRNLSKTINGAIQAYAIGYTLSKAGVITDTNAEGYSDGGAYVKIGDHYVPVGMFGFFAPNIVLGHAAYNGLEGNKGGNPAVEISKTIGNYAWNGLAVGQALGAENNLQRSVQAGMQKGHHAIDGIATAAAGAAGQFIPSITGDINAVLDQTPLNPTHEKANTRVGKGGFTATGRPSKAKDSVKSAGAGLLNKIPGVSQQLPRKKDVAANDLIDRTTHGDHMNAGGKAALQKANQEALDAKRPGSPAQIKAQLATDKAEFVKSNKDTADINGKFYYNHNGNVTVYDNKGDRQRAIDEQKFKDSGKDFVEKNGMVYQRGSNGKVTAMEKKDYDYKQAADNIQTAKNSGDVTGHQAASQKLLENISWQLNHADLTEQQRYTLAQKALDVQQEFAKVQQYGGFTKPKGADTYATPQITNAKPEYVRTIQEMGAKYGLDINALMSVAAMEGLGGGVGDNGHAFGPFQMNDAGGVLTGKFKSGAEAQKYAESAAGIEDAIKQIAAVAKGKTGKDAIEAIVTKFERSANQSKEIANALALYTGGRAVLADNGGSARDGGVSISASNSGSSKAARSAAALVKSNTIGDTPDLGMVSLGDLKPQKAGSDTPIPIIKPQTSGAELIKKRTITVK